MPKTDRRVQRTRAQLQKALIELISERHFDTITIQEIADRASVGRTTFYLHFHSKDELFMSCHTAIVSEFHSGPFLPHLTSRQELLSLDPPAGLTSAYRHLKEAWERLSPIFQGKDGALLLRRMRDSSAQEIETNLRACFAQTESAMPLDVLANYLAGAQLALVQWWLETRRTHTPEDLAHIYHRLRRAAIHEAFGLTDSR